MTESITTVPAELRLPEGELFFILGFNPEQKKFRIIPLSEAPDTLPLGVEQDFRDDAATAFGSETESDKGVWYQVSDETWAAYQEVIGTYLSEGRNISEALVTAVK